MPNHRPRAAAKPAPSQTFTAIILLSLIVLGAWALHGGASDAPNAAGVLGP